MLTILQAFWAGCFPSCFTVVPRASRFIEFQTKVAHFCFCLVRIKMPLLMCFWEPDYFIQCRCWEELCSPYAGANPRPILDKNLHPWVQKFYPVCGLGSGGRLPRLFQTPTLCWIHFSLRAISPAKGMNTKTHKQNIATQPVPGQSPRFVMFM